MRRVEDMIVLGHKWLNYKTFIIEMEAPDGLPPIEPGNFAEIRVNNSPLVFLRRPFSVYDVNPENRTISFFVKIIGEGTRLLGEMRKGDKLNIIYPLGNSFKELKDKRILIIGGGTGIAPFLLLARKLKYTGNEITFIFGGRTSDDIVLVDTFSQFGDVQVTTEDGTLGEKGLITNHSFFRAEKPVWDQVYTCGPEAMMKAVSVWCRSNGIPCEVSLENTMACGFGACLCCIVNTQDGNKCVCTEGPVFDVNYLKWQN